MEKIMAKFHVHVAMYNDFIVEADNEEEATAKVLSKSRHESLDGADYQISDVSEMEVT
jgi:hypothetical protein